MGRVIQNSESCALSELVEGKVKFRVTMNSANGPRFSALLSHYERLEISFSTMLELQKNSHTVACKL